jgi:hypothetical protein
MTFSDWFVNNWVDLARLVVQCGILAVVVWYSRKILKTLRASQEQIGALLRLSVTDSAAQERTTSIAEPALAPPGFVAPAPAEAPRNVGVLAAAPAAVASHGSLMAHAPEREQTLGGRVAMDRAAIREPEPMREESSSFTPWVAAPATQTAEPVEDLAERMADSRRNLGRWLKEPSRRSGGVNPFRRMIRWLQAPAGH